MTNKPTGGPAYPQATQTFQENMSGGRYVLTEQQDGMTLRDYFAGQALAGDMANGSEGVFGSDVSDDYLAMRAEFLYRMADAMIAARG
jgi:hypothetical protein